MYLLCWHCELMISCFPVKCGLGPVPCGGAALTPGGAARHSRAAVMFHLTQAMRCGSTSVDSAKCRHAIYPRGRRRGDDQLRWQGGEPRWRRHGDAGSTRNAENFIRYHRSIIITHKFSRTEKLYQSHSWLTEWSFTMTKSHKPASGHPTWPKAPN